MPNRTNPIDTIVADVVSTFDADLREDFDERAGIIEYDGRFPRAHAECLALIDVLRRHPEVLIRHPTVLTGITVLQIELDGATQWLVSTDLGYARRHLCDIGGVEIAVVGLADVIDEQYGGVSILTTLG